MSKLKVKLSSYCNAKGCEGKPGDIVEMSEAQAHDIVAGRGGILVDDVKKAAPKTPAK